MLALTAKTTVQSATDSDGDGYSDAIEQFVGTNPNQPCSSTTTANDEATDAWPPDFNDDKKVDIMDVTLLRARFGSNLGDATYQKRFDLNADNTIDILDVNAIRVPYDTVCNFAAPTPSPGGGGEPNPTPGPGDWAFLETFDGAPANPQAYLSSRFDIVVGSNDADGVMDGQVLVSDPPLVLDYGTIEAGHGPNCGAPIGTSQNNHNISVDFDPQGFQTNTRPQLTYQCNKHIMTVAKAGYGVVSLMPRQLFDFAGRTGTISLDTNVYGYFREWWDVYVVPEDDMLEEMVIKDEGGTGEALPKQGVRFTFSETKPGVDVISNYQFVDQWRSGQSFKQAFPSDPAITDPKTRRNFQLQLSTTGWGFKVQKQDGTYWTNSGTFDSALPFSRAEIRIEHHSYNPTKEGVPGEPWSQYTFHWDNIAFDGPVLPARRAFEAPLVYLSSNNIDTVSSPVTINVNGTSSPRLIAHIYSQAGMTDPADTSHWAQVSVNNGPWLDIKLRKPVDPGLSDRSWSTVDTPLSGVVSGQNTLRFRYHARPGAATWQADGLHVKDIEIQTEDRALVASATSVPGGAAAVSNSYDCTIAPVADTPADGGASILRIS